MPKKYTEDEQLAQHLADALQELPDNWIMCRDMRHAWEVDQDFHVTKAKGGKATEIKRTLACLRCGTGRVETYHSTKWGLEKVAQHYTYPDNYQIKGVPRGVKPSFIVQGEQYRRAMEKITHGASTGKTKVKTTSPTKVKLAS